MGRFVPKDTFYKKAKLEGYRARSAYKLKEIQDKYRIIKKGDKVLDLGCAPGSFIQIIAQEIGRDGLVVGIDIQPVTPIPDKNVSTITGDIRDIDVSKILQRFSIPHFDVITCDIAPNLSGIREADEKNIDELYDASKHIVVNTLRTGGHFILKSFFSESFSSKQKDLKNLFVRVSIFKPTSSRGMSSEIFFVCKERMG
ncbi:MAG TPA: RlmE family RNA methyltransferase [Syntrophorhabdaceae bacterium]|jgi:23S rRNA (uridine2552-2'-O)-methyltransferase|nr:RlmE family RNA methyltransferase [Syntrophorhabdaceae bacterium]MDI9561879.1 RlmE family RNA methyltransferase [Pseudomonadota bacterium]OQC50886.1 MAG: Ribosomal RNA large subunit methyltransferase E [Deltaproteobacteria bacterium ADurb.Bin026]MBP8697620.1 RlmE family RNA methyltransferase [Syntrophorhabdaceae bacterium]MBV6505448.1 Ribosomal RNA large subunit methyltransferase E [Syntrophorhabdaceae bacterium]